MIAGVLAAVGVMAAAVPATTYGARLAGLGGRAPLTARVDVPPWYLDPGTARLLAAAGAVVMLTGSKGDVVVAAALGAVAVGAGVPGAALVLAGVAAALRVRSSSLAHVAGGHAVLGVAALSSSPAIAASALLATAGCLLVAATSLPSRPRGGMAAVIRSPERMADALVPFVALATGLVVAVGPVTVGYSSSGWWVGARAVLLVTALVGAGGLRRITRTLPPRGVAIAAVVVAAAGATLAGLA